MFFLAHLMVIGMLLLRKETKVKFTEHKVYLGETFYDNNFFSLLFKISIHYVHIVVKLQPNSFSLPSIRAEKEL